MVSKVGISRKKRARRDPAIFGPTWFHNDPNRNEPGYSPCFARCKKYTPTMRRDCSYGNCMEWYCGTCRRFSGGMGPIDCPCDHYGNCSGGKGHGTPEEQVSRTYHMVPNTDPDSDFSFSIVTPSRKRKVQRR